jgi:hypothetical protein
MALPASAALDPGCPSVQLKYVITVVCARIIVPTPKHRYSMRSPIVMSSQVPPKKRWKDEGMEWSNNLDRANPANPTFCRPNIVPRFFSRLQHELR